MQKKYGGLENGIINKVESQDDNREELKFKLRLLDNSHVPKNTSTEMTAYIVTGLGVKLLLMHETSADNENQ